MADFERDIELLEEYKQWTVVHKNPPDTSPTAFMVHRAQVEAFDKLEELEQWFQRYSGRVPQAAVDEFMEIMEGTD